MALVRYIHLNPLRAGLVSESTQLVMLFRDTRTWNDHRGVGRPAAFGTADRKPIRSARAKNSFGGRIEAVVIIKQWTSPKYPFGNYPALAAGAVFRLLNWLEFNENGT